MIWPRNWFVEGELGFNSFLGFYSRCALLLAFSFLFVLSSVFDTRRHSFCIFVAGGTALATALRCGLKQR